MKRKFIFLIYMMLALSFASYSQTATIGSVSPSSYAVGDVITVPVEVDDFIDIAAVTLGVGFDDQVLTFMSFTSPLTGALCNVTYPNGPQVNLAWSNFTVQTLNPGTILFMSFTYLGGTCDLTFNPEVCEIIQFSGGNLNPLDVLYTDGEVPQTIASAVVSLKTVTDAEIGSTVVVPVEFSGFGNNIGAVTLNIAFDDARLALNNVEGFAPLTGLLYYVNGNIIKITWSNASNITSVNGEKINLEFVFIGPTAADVTFEPLCDIKTTELISLPVLYSDGSVLPVATPASVLIGTTEAFSGNTMVPVPVTFADFPGNVGSLTFKIAYDSDKVTFQSALGAGDLSNMLYYSDDDMIYISWTSTAPGTGKNINDDDMALFFTYLGGGDAPLTFAAGTEITSNSAVIIATEYSNGGIIQGDSPYSVSLDMVTAYPNNQVTNTITFDGFPSGVGSMTLYVEYDDTKMTLQDVEGTNALSNILWFDESNGKEGDPIVPRVKITWTGTAGIDPDGSTIQLTFIYLGGGATPLVFGPGCVISDTEADPFDVSYYDGGIRIGSKISGNVTYDNSFSTPLSNCTVTLKEGLDVIATTTTDGTGYYEFNFVANGSYNISVTTTKPWCGAPEAGNADLFMIKAHMLTYITLTGIRFTAGDVNNSADISNADIFMLKARMLGYSSTFPIGDWVFENPVFAVSGIDVTVNVKGLCSGDVNGSFIPTP